MAKKQFKTESKRVLDLMINSIYTNQEIFLRELISNASDAIDKLCYLSLTDNSVSLSRDDFKIKLSASKEARTLTLSDNGIGMSREDLENNLGVIAKSGSLQFKNEMEKTSDTDDIDIIGQFGVGFYSAFMVAEKIQVVSKKFGEEIGYIWESAGADGYTIKEFSKENVGTDIIMYLKADNEDNDFSKYLDNYTISDLVKKYSDFVRWPIAMDFEGFEEVESGRFDDDAKPIMENVPKIEERVLNSRVPLWQRPKDEVTKEELDEFYFKTFYDYIPPVSHIRVNAEGTMEYKALLFVPEKTPSNFYTESYEAGLALYCNGVKISEHCKEVLPDAFRFVRGVVDSPDFPLNISRETLQNGRQLKLISNNLEKKIKNELKRLMDDDSDAYEKFYKSFAPQLKYALCNHDGAKKDLLEDLIMFYSSCEHELVPLREYKEKMKDEQKLIYYVCTNSIEGADSLPQAELIRDKGYEILYLIDEMDEFVIRALKEYAGLKFCNITSDDLGLASEEEKEELSKKSQEHKELLDFIKECLGDKIIEAKISEKLKTQAVYLGTQGEVSLEMEKYFAKLNNEMSMMVKAQRILELNENHKAFISLKEAFEADKEKAKDMVSILHSQALLIAGLPLENPAEYTELICKLF